MIEMKNSGIKWIGEIPAEWRIKKCKYVSSFINGYAFNSQDLTINYQFPVIRIGDIVNGCIDFENCQGVNTNEGLENYRILDNDILLAMSGATVGKVGAAKSPPCSYINQRVGIIRSKNYRYLFYCLNTSQFVEHILLEASGSAQPNVSGTVYGNYSIPFPTMAQQKNIADFLDKKCAEIDVAITKTKETIEEYKKLKQSIITETITKGICGDRPMKNSGIEWIGNIPAEWKTRKGKWVIKRLERPVKEDDGVITCFRDGEVTLRSNRREAGFTLSFQEIGYQGIEPGDLVVHGMDGFAGAIGISDSRGKGTPVLNILDSDQNKRYIMYYLRNMAYNGIFLALATGIRVRSCDTNWNKIKELPYILPPIEEQNEIVDYLDKKCAEIDALIAKKTALIEEMESYKKSVIYEYVTGKKEVPNG